MLNTLLDIIKSFDVKKEYILKCNKILYKNLTMSINSKVIILVHYLTSCFIVSQCLSPGDFCFSSVDLVHLFITPSLLLESIFQSILCAKKTIHYSFCVTVSHLQSKTISIQTILNNILELVHPLPLHIVAIFF